MLRLNEEIRVPKSANSGALLIGVSVTAVTKLLGFQDIESYDTKWHSNIFYHNLAYINLKTIQII